MIVIILIGMLFVHIEFCPFLSSIWTKSDETDHFFLAIKPFASATASMADLPYPSAPILSAHS